MTLNAKQQRALELLREPVPVESFRNWKKKQGRFIVQEKRQLYQTMYLTSYCVTHTGDVPDSPMLTREEAFGLVNEAGLVPAFPDAPNVQCWHARDEALQEIGT